MPPVQGRNHSAEPSKVFKTKLGTSNIVSYEDLLIAQYIDDIKKGPDVGNKSGSSPYLGRYTSLEEGLSKQHMRPRSSKRDRPSSAFVESRSRVYTVSRSDSHNSRPYSAVNSQQKPKIDAKFIADPELWDPATPREERPAVRRTRSAHTRPRSATNRPGSAKKSYSALIDHEIYMARRPKKKQPLYKRQPYVIRCTVYKNGDRDIFTQMAAPNVKLLLESCTNKLQLNGAARRIFLEDGTEIFETDEIPKDGEIYVSNGEAFKNPFKSIIQRHEQKEHLQWTMSGLTLPADQTGKKKKSKFLLSKRFKNLVTVSNRRIMVFLNGQSTNCHEIISDMKSMDDFLADVTNRLALRSHARIVYDWSGTEIKVFDQIPILDPCLQEPGTPVLGPVWVSCGGGFSPSGSSKFLEEIITRLRRSIKDCKYHKSQFARAKDNEKVELTSLPSLTEGELDKNIESLTDDISKMTSYLKKMKALHSELSEEAKIEEDVGYSYTLQNIKEIDATHKSVGGVGLKLKVYANGDYTSPSTVYFNTRQASRGIKDSKLIFERLLDQCAGRVAAPSSQGTKFARRLFDANGDEITEIHSLKSEQEVFVSMGEAFIVPYVLCLQAHFEQVKGVEMHYPPEMPQRQTAVFDQSAAFLESSKTDWEGTIGFPADYHWVTCSESMELAQRDEILQSKELDINSHWLVHKDPSKRDLVLFPSLVVSDRKKRGSNEIWPAEAQLWVLNKAGYISCRGIPQIVMTVLDTRVDCQTKSKLGTRVTGYAVGLQKRQEGNPAQQWRFTKDGAIYSMLYEAQQYSSQSELILTFLGAKHSQIEEDMVNNEVEGLPSGFIPHLAVCEKISGKDSNLQRFAMKQERFENLGQWKNNDHEVVTNPEFNKQAYSWPVNANNEWSDEFDWPMEFYFVAKAPPLQRSKKDSTGHTPLRLLVMKNGETDSHHCSPVVGPDLTNMIRDLSKQNNKKSHHHHGHSHGSGAGGQPKKKKANAWSSEADQDDSVSDFPLHCDDLTFRELEFRLFLERCTGAMNMPFAARRLFDEEGREYHTLKDLTRDQVVYVTCGEAWIDPSISKAESQRRFLLTNLASDIAQIRQFCALRDTEGYVLEVEGAVVPNAKIILNHCPEMQTKIETEAAEEQEMGKEKEETRAIIDSDLLQASSTAHERSHQKMDDKGDKLKWPWERLANAEFQDLQEAPARSPSPQRARSGAKTARNVQKFVYSDGYLACVADQSLVLAVASNSESQVLEVTIAKRKPDELSQLWVVKPNGVIQNRSQRDTVLTVAMPTNRRRDEEGLSLNYVGCQVIVQKRRTSQFGSASQKWNIDPETGFIFAFHTNHLDVEITAANKANVCTYAVTKDELDQPGYILSLPSKSSNKQDEVVVCTSCARAMSGRFKLNKLPDSYDFSCAMGTSKRKELKQVGSFHCLNGKVDLSTFEAINTLDEWETKYNKLYDENSVRSIAKEISASETPQSVKIYAYKNGEGREKEGQLIIGSSIIGLLDQCTYRLGMSNAARRLYTRDGALMLDIDDLVGWAVEHYLANIQAKNPRKQSTGNARIDPNGTPETSSGSTSSLAQYQTLTVETSADADNYHIVNDEPIDVEFALLEVTNANCNNHIALLNVNGTESDLLYEIIIGRTSESAIMIHPSAAAARGKGESFEDMVTNTASALEKSEAVTEKFWFSWSNCTIRVGRGEVVGEQEFLSATDTESRRVHHIVVSAQGADTTWTFKIPVSYGSVPNSHGTGPTEINKLMDKVELNDDDDEDTGSKKDDLSEVAEVPKRTLSRPKTAVTERADPPPLEVILRYPVEVWASASEKFIKPEKVAADQKEMRHYRKLVSDITFSLQKEKHKLRQLQGRRLTGQQPGHYEATGSSVNPVVRKNHWQEPSYNETLAHDEVHQLQSQQMEVKARQRAQAGRSRASSRLYTQPTMKRVLAYVNGEPISRAQYIWGDNLAQILQNATTRLNMKRAAKCIFSLLGQQIQFEELEKDQIVCVSVGGGFQRPKDMQQEVEIRANWTRARKQLGPEATDITIHAHLNPDIDVDPFGPPSLVSRAEKSQRT